MSFLKSIILILCLLWSNQAWAGGGKEDSEQIDKLTVALQKLDPMNYDGQKALFERHFSGYLKESGWVEENDPHAKHFYLDQKHIDREKSLP